MGPNQNLQCKEKCCAFDIFLGQPCEHWWMDGNFQTWMCNPFLFLARWTLCPQGGGQQSLINHTVAHELSKGLSLLQMISLCFNLAQGRSLMQFRAKIFCLSLCLKWWLQRFWKLCGRTWRQGTSRQFMRPLPLLNTPLPDDRFCDLLSSSSTLIHQTQIASPDVARNTFLTSSKLEPWWWQKLFCSSSSSSSQVVSGRSGLCHTKHMCVTRTHTHTHTHTNTFNTKETQ